MNDDAAAIVDTPTIAVEPILTPSQPIMASGGGGDDGTGTVGADASLNTALDSVATPLPNETNVAAGRQTSIGRSSGNPNSGRGRSSNDRGGGGRIPMGGRGLAMSSGRSGQQYGGRGSYGRGYNQQQQRMPMQVHANSGVPFGHVPAYLPGSSSLVEELDQRILLVLRDGKHIIGVR